MDIKLINSKIKILNTNLQITGSKSETNRLLLLQALYPEIEIENISNSDDSDVMIKILKDFSSLLEVPPLEATRLDVHHAGTAMRFLTAFFAIQEGKEIVLTGSSRMKERPIQILVDALNQLGAEITYEENEGFPPIRIKGKKIINNKVALPANVSSQYISALLLIAPKLENGLELTLEGKITSLPYIQMTLALLNEIGVKTKFENDVIAIEPLKEILVKNITVESDWSSASYWYSFIALSEIGAEMTLASYKQNSLQGDSVLVSIYEKFGVETVFNKDNSIRIIKNATHLLEPFTYDLSNAPDIAQTIAVTCFGLGISCDLKGLHTLKIKETDRLEALKIELSKLGAEICVTDNSLHLKEAIKINENICISTYQDHRMAMAFAPLALRTSLIIEDAEVVSKSYPLFWEDIKKVGIEILEAN